MVEEKNARAVVIREGEFDGIFFAVLKVKASIHEFECHQPALGIKGFGFYHVAIYCPYWPWDEERIHGKASYDLNGRHKGAGPTLANFHTVNFPPGRGIGCVCGGGVAAGQEHGAEDNSQGYVAKG